MDQDLEKPENGENGENGDYPEPGAPAVAL